MKKLLILILLFLSITAISVNAEEINYKNVITDKTTIEEDFKILKMNVSDYYIPKSYSYDKWYIIAMSEAYRTNQIQTYFYLYNPAGLNSIPPLKINYSIDNGDVKSSELTILENNSTHGYLKVNGFKYTYTSNCTISVSEIISTYEEDDPINSGEVIKTERKDSSGFQATLRHSKMNNSFGIELEFNSTLVIDEFKVVKQKIEPENNGWNMLDTAIQSSTLFGGEIDTYDLRFYNFNFPDHIKPDSIEYSLFKYDTIYYHQKRNGDIEELSKEIGLEHDYLPSTHQVKSGLFSSTLEFQVFVLGNRISKGEFGYIEFSPENKEKFNYDCSILLEVLPVETKYYRYMNELSMWVTEKETWFNEIDNIEFLELHYKKDGVHYKSDVIAPTVPKEDFEDGGGEPVKPADRELSWFEKLLIKIANFILKMIKIDHDIVPNWIKYVISSAILFAGFIACIVGLPWILSHIPVVGGFFGEIFSSIVTVIQFVITLPFKIIMFPFKKKEKDKGKKDVY